MIDLCVQLIDRIIALIKQRASQERTRKTTERSFVVDVIDPLYSDMEAIQRNYYSTLMETQRSLTDPNEPLDRIIHDLRQLRGEFAPVRVEVRMLAAELYQISADGNLVIHRDSKGIRDFVVSIAQFLGYVAFSHDTLNEGNSQVLSFLATYSSPSASLLRSIERINLSKTATDKSDPNSWREDGLQELANLLHNLNQCWDQFVGCYAKLRLTLLLTQR